MPSLPVFFSIAALTVTRLDNMPDTDIEMQVKPVALNALQNAVTRLLIHLGW